MCFLILFMCTEKLILILCMLLNPFFIFLFLYSLQKMVLQRLIVIARLRHDLSDRKELGGQQLPYSYK